MSELGVAGINNNKIKAMTKKYNRLEILVYQRIQKSLYKLISCEITVFYFLLFLELYEVQNQH